MRWHRFSAILQRIASDSWANLAATPLRSALALLGIIIGTAAVVALINISANAAHQSRLQFAAMGADTVLLRGDPAYIAANDRTVSQVLRAITVGQPAVIRAAGGQVRFHTQAFDTMIVGSEPRLQSAARLRVASGRFLSPFDGDANVVVLGANIVHRFADLGRRLRIGDMVALGNYQYRIVGVLLPASANPLLATDFNNLAIVPQASLTRLLREPAALSVLVQLTTGTDPTLAASELAGALARRYGSSTFQISTAQQLLESLGQQQRLFFYLSVGVGVVAAAVGGVGIMTVMLTSVLERRKEIGLRLAIGASPRRIAAQFLVETALLAALGCTAGLLLGHVIACIVAHFAQWDHVVAWLAIPAAAAMSLAVAIGAGFYPALRASRMDPVQALRAD